MTFTYFKRGAPVDAAATADVSSTVARLLAEIEAGGEAAATRIAREFDRWDGDIILSDETIAAACARVPQSLKDDIAYAHENIARFAQAQRDSFTETEIELRPGLRAGQKLIPVQAAGCYIPGGRYSHIASAMMTVTTAKVAGVAHVAAVSPPRADAAAGIPDAILYTLHHCGADRVLALGGIQGVAAMAFGLFGLPRADMLVGPGNQFVAEAKRLLYGRVGIDMVAGPTDSMVIADASADALVVAWDLVGQAEHGANSPVWLVTTDTELAAEVRRLVPLCAAELPNQTVLQPLARGRVWVKLSSVKPPRLWRPMPTVSRLNICMCRPVIWIGGGRAFGLMVRCFWGPGRRWLLATRPQARTTFCPPVVPRAIPAGYRCTSF